jgi:superfamily II DNA or RNA helicase
MPCTVDIKNKRLYIKFNSLSKDVFYEKLEQVKSLYDRQFIKGDKAWEASITDNNIVLLKEYGFEFINEAKKLLGKDLKEPIRIILSNNYIKIISNYSIFLKIENYFIVDDYKYAYNKHGFDSSRIKKVRFLRLSEEYGLLPIGFLDDLKLFLKKEEMIFNIIDDRKIDLFKFSIEEIKKCLNYLILYDYQIQAVKKCLNNYNGLIKLPTGSGKTEIFLVLCTLMKKRTLILFSRIDLAQQTFDRAEYARLDVGIVQGDNIDENHMIVMCTIQSSDKLKNKYEMVIVDEVHNAKSKSYRKLLRKKYFIYRFGFSATPFADGKKNKLGNYYIKSFIGDIIYELPSSDLIDLKKIAKPKIRFIEIKGNVVGNEWLDIEEIGIIENNKRNNIIVDLCRKNNKVIVLIKKIRHGEILEKMISNSIFLYGNTKSEKKKKMIKDFENRKDIIIIASTIFDEGINIKSIKNLIIAGGGNGQRKAIQRLGRGLRITDNKFEVNIFDFYDKTNLILETHSKNRISFYKKEGFSDIEII